MPLWRLFSTVTAAVKNKHSPLLTSAFTNPNFIIRTYSTSFLITKTPKSARSKHVQHESERIPHFEKFLHRDNHYRFVVKTKDFLLKQPQQVLRLDDAGKLYRELGFPRGRKVLKFIERYPLVFQTYRHLDDDKIWFGFTDFMDTFLEEEKMIMDQLEKERIDVVRKLLMMSSKKRIPLSKIYHCHSLFGIPEDFRDRVRNYPVYFNTVVEGDGKIILELVNWDQKLAVSALEQEFMVDEERAKKAFQFKVKHGKLLELDENNEKKMNLLNALPLVSPYSDGASLDVWTLEAEKYRLGVIHEFLSLTLEKRASIHHIVEFKEELSLTKHNYSMLLKQPRSFYMAGTEMNWVVFLKDAYGEDGVLIHKDPQVLFNEKFYEFADKQEL